MFRLRTWILPLMLCACAASGAIRPGQEFTLTVGASATLPDGATLRYRGVANDSRCPPRVQCIRAGDADVLFDVVRGDASPSRIVLNSERARAATLGAWRLQLLDLAPGALPRATLRLEAQDAGDAP